MSSPFDHLTFDAKLACDFVAFFARFEYALKAAGFAKGDGHRVDPAWDDYARAIAAGFQHLMGNPELLPAIDYLLNRPPKKQVLDNGLKWRDAPPDAGTSRAEQVLLMVRRVRNNLFHGGKFVPPEAGADQARDRLLVEHSTVVLRACLPLNPQVEAAFNA